MEGRRRRDGSRGCTCRGEGEGMGLEDAPAGGRWRDWSRGCTCRGKVDIGTGCWKEEEGERVE